MKRVVILSLVVLELALVVLVWWSSTREPRPEVAPQPASAPDSGRDCGRPTEPQLLSESERADREPLALARLLDPEKLPAEQPGRVQVHGQVVRAGSGTPVRSGLVGASWVPVDRETLESLARSHPPGVDTRRELHASRIATTLDDEGRFELEVPRSALLGRVRVAPLSAAAAASARVVENFAPCERPLRFEKDDAQIEIRIEVGEGFDLRGVVVDAANGAPLAGASIATLVGWEAGASDVTDGGGRFLLRALRRTRPDWSGSMRIACRGYVGETRELGPREADQGREPLRIELARGVVIAGRLLDESGQPLAGAWLALSGEEADLGPGEDARVGGHRARTDAEGRFELGCVRPAARVCVEVAEQSLRAGVLEPLRHEIAAADEAAGRLELCATRLGEVLVRAARSAGEPLDSSQFQVLCENEPRARVRLGGDDHARLLRAPLGVPLSISAYAAAPDGTGFVRGRIVETLCESAAEPRVLLVRLDETGRFRAPEPAADTARLELPAPEYLRACVDLRIVGEESGRGLELPDGVYLSASGSALRAGRLVDGRVRVSGPPGKCSLHLESGTRVLGNFELEIPSSGYACAEWRLEGER